MEFKRFKHIEDNFLTREECVGFIEYAETQGFDEALIQTRSEGQTINKDIRDNDRHIWESRDLAIQLWELVKPFVPENVDGWSAHGLNERFRIYRYENGQQFKVHPDGSFIRDDNEHSKISVIIYLNSDFEGGETEFVMPHEIIKPEDGKLLLFSHKQLHKGNPVTSGTKYVLRTDVMYRTTPIKSNAEFYN